MKNMKTIPIFTQKDLIEYFPKFYPMFNEENDIETFLYQGIDAILFTNKKNVSKQYQLFIELNDKINICVQELDKKKKCYHIKFDKEILLNKDFIKYVKWGKRVLKEPVDIYDSEYRYGMNAFYTRKPCMTVYGITVVRHDDNIDIPYMSNSMFIDIFKNKVFNNIFPKSIEKFLFDHDVFKMAFPHNNIINGEHTRTFDDIYKVFLTYEKCNDDNYIITLKLINKDREFIMRFDKDFIEPILNHYKIDLEVLDDEIIEFEEFKNKVINEICNISNNKLKSNKFKSNCEVITKTTVVLPNTNCSEFKTKKSECKNTVIKKRVKCPHCNGTNFYRRGKLCINNINYQRFSCNKCGKIFKIPVDILDQEYFDDYKKR